MPRVNLLKAYQTEQMDAYLSLSCDLTPTHVAAYMLVDGEIVWSASEARTLARWLLRAADAIDKQQENPK